MPNETEPVTSQGNGATALATVPSHATDLMNPFSSRDAFNGAWGMAKALAQSSLVPTLFRNSTENCIIAMEYAARLQVSVLAVMQNLSVINGKPGLSSVFLIASVNSCGRFTPLRFEFAGELGKDSWACRAVAKERASGEILEGEWITWLMAIKEGWVGRKGSKWQTMPGQMMRYRSAAFWTRAYCPEISLGFHTTDELEDLKPLGEALPDALPTDLSPGGAESLNAILGLQQKAPAADVIEGELEDEQKSEEPAQQTLEVTEAKGKNP